MVGEQEVVSGLTKQADRDFRLIAEQDIVAVAARNFDARSLRERATFQFRLNRVAGKDSGSGDVVLHGDEIVAVCPSDLQRVTEPGKVRRHQFARLQCLHREHAFTTSVLFAAAILLVFWRATQFCFDGVRHGIVFSQPGSDAMEGLIRNQRKPGTDEPA